MGDVQPFGRRSKRRAASSSDQVDARAVGPSDDPTPEAERKAQIARLLQQAARGDESAFAELYDHLSPIVYGVVLRVVRNPSLADEVTQEVFLEIWRLAPRFDATRGSATSWAATIAHRRAVDRVRSEQSARNREERDHLMTPDPVDPIAEAADDRFQYRRVQAALAELTDVQRSAIELAYFGGHTYREVAVLLDIAEGTAKTRIRDGLIRLRDHLGVTA